MSHDEQKLLDVSVPGVHQRKSADTLFNVVALEPNTPSSSSIMKSCTSENSREKPSRDDVMQGRRKRLMREARVELSEEGEDGRIVSPAGPLGRENTI